MRFVLVLSIAGIALLAGSLVENARAEQAFACDGGRIVYARGLAELERLKTTDPCVAGYFGKVPLRGAAPADSAVPTVGKTSSAAAASPVPAEVAAASKSKSAAEEPASDGPIPIRVLNARPGEDNWRSTSR